MNHSQRGYFFPALILFAAGLVVSLALPGEFREGVFRLRDLILSQAGSVYILLNAVFLLVVLVAWAGPWGRIKLGREEDRPDFRTVSWFALLFCTALAAGLVFFGVAEPLHHYARPPAFAGVEPRSEAAAQWALVNSFFHWGLNAWCIYVVLAIPLALAVHRQGLPCRVSSALHPLLGDRVHGRLGKAVDTACILVSVGGVSASLGYIGLQLTAGLEDRFGLAAGPGLTVALIAVLTTVVILSVLSGLHRGLKLLSNVNLYLGLALLAFVFAAGPASFTLLLGGRALGEYVLTQPLLTFRFLAGEAPAWRNEWTVMYYAWWLSWAPMVALFFARVSRGRTVRELVTAALFAPVLATFLWFSVFGGSSIYLDLYSNPSLSRALVERGMEFPLFVLLQQLPWTSLTIPLFLVLIAVFFITSGDSSTLSIAMLSSGGNPDPPLAMRAVWGFMQGAIAAVLITLGGTEALQAACIVAGFLILFVMLGAAAALLRIMYAGQPVGPTPDGPPASSPASQRPSENSEPSRFARSGRPLDPGARSR